MTHGLVWHLDAAHDKSIVFRGVDADVSPGGNPMNKRSKRSWLITAAVPVIGLTMMFPAASAFGAAHGASSTGVTGHSRVIVFLRDTAKGLAPRTAVRANVVRSAEVPVLTSLRASGATGVTTGKTLPFIIATVTPAARASIASNPGVLAVIPDSVIHETSPTALGEPFVAGTHRSAVRSHVTPSICGTALNPESDPEAVSNIKADQAVAAGYDGAGVTVAYIADGVDPTNPDFQRNAAYASAGSPTGTPVLTQYNFTGDPSGTPTSGGEAYLDSSSIGAQGNQVYDLSTFVNAAHPTPSSPCDIKITGAAPGANIMGLDVFSSVYDTTESNFIQAIDFATSNGAKVINESFGSNNFPDTALDATRIADDDAIAAGVTVVASSGDSGVTSTIGSPATDPSVISVGASTTFRSYEQTTYAGINDPKSNGTWLNSNISSISSGGFSMSGGNTVDLVAPGDSNWALCTASALFADCRNFNSGASSIEFTGGTSESSPLTAGAAADVIQAYASTHHGVDPSPALVKQILVSSASDISAPAEQQGSGLLNVLAAVKLAASLPGTTGPKAGGNLLSPTQINVSQKPGQSTSTKIKVTNMRSTSETVDLSTRSLTKTVRTTTGSFCLNPSAVNIACGPPTASSFPIWSGVTEVHQDETFFVPSGTSRLNFSADYQYTGQGSLLHVGLIDPSGSFAGYSLPQGLADYANAQISNPKQGNWTAVFFTEKDGATPGGIGTSGTIQWSANSLKFAAAGKVSPSSLTIPSGGTRTATLTVKSPATSGDTAQSVVVRTVGGATNTIPVTIRTLVAVSRSGGSFAGVLTGGNGRGNPASMQTFQFAVPSGKRNLSVSAHFADTGDAVTAFLIDPNGQAVASSDSVTQDSHGNIIATGDVSVYKDAPQAGAWKLVLDWLSPVSGSELNEPFTGTIAFNAISVSSNLPKNAKLVQGKSYTFQVRIKNTGSAPQAFFLDPRETSDAAYPLGDLFGSDQGMSLPLPPGLAFPIYSVPADTSSIVATLSGSVPVTFDTEPFTGDPDLSPALPAPSTVSITSPTSESLTFSAPYLMPGFWYLNPSEIGPYGAGGAPAATASSSMFAVTEAFNPTVTTTTGDLWQQNAGYGVQPFTPAYVLGGKSVTLNVTITPTAASGTHVSGLMNVSNTYLVNELIGITDSGGDQLASLPFSYKVK
jgi:hypothetical protein